MTKVELICIVCPLGCNLEVELEADEVKKITGNSCSRGKNYAVAECINPTRVLTTTILVRKATVPLVSVKSNGAIPKGLLMEAMEIIKRVEVEAPIKIGDILIDNLLGTGIDLIATTNITSSFDL